jgi:polyribonucleotide nucleotidyltransferase
MGLILGDESKGEAPVILTDILGSEDALGDMDFKVAGDGDGISAFQMDIKVEGITLPVLREALESARTLAWFTSSARWTRRTRHPRGR